MATWYEYSLILERKLKPLPWKLIGALAGASFVLATAISTLTAYVMLPTKAEEAKGDKDKKGQNQVVSLGKANTPSLDQKGIDAIIGRNIFNSEGETGEDLKKEATPGVSQDAIKTDLPIKLVGTIYGGDPQHGLAVIENTSKGSQINSFMVGEIVYKEGANIAEALEVYPNKVFLKRQNGQREYIELERKPLFNRSKRKRGKASSVAPIEPGGVAPIAIEPPPESFKEEGFERTGSEITMSDTYRQKILGGDFTKVLQDAKAEPNMVGNELRGFRLERIRKDSIYEKSGFMNGDVIEEINGVPLTDTAQAIKLLNSLRNEREIEVRGKRGGGTKTWNLNVR